MKAALLWNIFSNSVWSKDCFKTGSFDTENILSCEGCLTVTCSRTCSHVHFLEFNIQAIKSALTSTSQSNHWDAAFHSIFS